MKYHECRTEMNYKIKNDIPGLDCKCLAYYAMGDSETNAMKAYGDGRCLRYAEG